MLISMFLAWAAVVCAGFAALKWIARISGSRGLNRFFHRVHIPFGLLLLVTGVVHGVLAGNLPGTAWSDIQLAPVLFTLNWGTACLVLAAALGGTYLLRKPLKKLWMPAHRVLTLLLIAVLALHLLDTGIHVIQRLTAELGQGQAQTEDTAEDSDDVNSTGQVTFSGAVLKDGTYSGSAEGFRGTITVSVTVSGGAVTEIAVVSQQDTAQYFSRAETVLDTIENAQSLEVDAVTGATYSSAGLIQATANALQDAVQSGTLQVTQVELSGGHHGGRK